MHRTVSTSDLIRGMIEDVDIFKIEPTQLPLRSQLTNIEQLAQSIKEKGLLQPIVVRPSDDDIFEIVAGTRRFNACKLLGWRKIPCHIVELDDREAFEISLIENLQRKTLNPIEQAEAFKKYVSDFGWGAVSDLARKIGRSHTFVVKRIKLLNLSKEVIEAVEKSAISSSVAQELTTVADTTKQSELADLVARRHLSLRNARTLINNSGLDMDNATFESTDLLEVERCKHAFDKVIITLRSSMTKISGSIDSVEESWIAHEMLMLQKNILHSQIDLLLKHKKKLVTYSYV